MTAYEKCQNLKSGKDISFEYKEELFTVGLFPSAEQPKPQFLG